MVMKHMLKTMKNLVNTLRIYTEILEKRGDIKMTKLLAKLAEKYARSTNTACFVLFAWHQPKMPASLIKKD